MAKHFRTAVDGWYYLSMVFVDMTVIISAVMVYLEGNIRGVVILVVTGMLTTGFMAWLMATRYEIHGGMLKVTSGPMVWQIPLASIRSVKPSGSMRSAPALSLQRLEVVYGQQRLLISPADQPGFMAALDAALGAARNVNE